MGSGRQGDKEIKSPCLSLPLSPCPLVPLSFRLSLSICRFNNGRAFYFRKSKKRFVGQRNRDTFSNRPPVIMRPDAQVISREPGVGQHPSAIGQGEGVKVIGHQMRGMWRLPEPGAIIAQRPHSPTELSASWATNLRERNSLKIA